jgi:hypothetical protein
MGGLLVECSVRATPAIMGQALPPANRALDHGQSPGLATRPALTGFRST